MALFILVILKLVLGSALKGHTLVCVVGFCIFRLRLRAHVKALMGAVGFFTLKRYKKKVSI